MDSKSGHTRKRESRRIKINADSKWKGESEVKGRSKTKNILLCKKLLKTDLRS